MKILGPLSRWMGYVSACVIVLLMLLVVTDVCGRYLSTWISWAEPVKGASEMASLMMIVVVFPALAWAALSEKHVKVDLIMERFSPKIQSVMNIITLLAALGIFIVVAWQSALESLATEDVSSLIKLPHAPFFWIMTAGMAVFCLSIIVLVIKNIAEARNK